jgi:hypothetical protein
LVLLAHGDVIQDTDALTVLQQRASCVIALRAFETGMSHLQDVNGQVSDLRVRARMLVG